jgi:HSP20 family protein
MAGTENANLVRWRPEHKPPGTQTDGAPALNYRGEGLCTGEAGPVAGTDLPEEERVMANIQRWDPFEDFDDLFRGVFLRPMRMEASEINQPVRIKIDVKEDDKSYTVHADIPGVKKEDISVSIDGNQVAISAEVKREKEEKQGEKVLRSERYTGKVYRAFALAQDVDQEGASARYESGVLELKLPKRAAAAQRRLTVQ